MPPHSSLVGEISPDSHKGSVRLAESADLLPTEETLVAAAA
jgi:hypothetical protein